MGMDTMPGNDSMDKQAPLAGLDPAELLRQGAVEDTLVDGAPASFQLPPMEEIAAAFPQFEILELIGQGGMGAVYKVRQKDLDRIVALKILPPAIGQSPEFSERFSREARALAKLNHPGIVTIHDFGQQGGLYFILMEFVDGVNLAQLMKSGRVSPREALAIVPQICDALQYAHDQGIVHRDIKPENLLLDRLGRVKVADFGIAKVVAAVCPENVAAVCDRRADATLAGKIIGTPQYMAPEQIESPSEVDHRADIYALGVVFYQMLTGELPGNELQAPSRKLHIDVRLDEIVLKALEKNPEQRYQQASVMGTRVETVVSEMGSAAVPAASFVTPSSGKRETGTPLDFRFSRAAIVGACWAPLFIIAFGMWTMRSSVALSGPAATQPPGPAWWQYLLMFTLLPLGITSPFGTTILGWISVTRIRRSAGKLHGMWLAVFDGLLFPLLILAGLIGWFWHWVFYDLIRAAIIAGQPELSTMERLIVDNTTAFTVLATLVSSLVAGFLVTRMAWRAVNAGDTSAPNQPPPVKNSTGRSLAIGCGGLVLLVLVLYCLTVITFWLMKPTSVDETHEKPILPNNHSLLERSANPARASGVPLVKKLAEYDWKDLAAQGRLGEGVTQTLDGHTVLKIENPGNAPINARLVTIENPPIKAMRYAVSGEIRYENVQGQGYMEMWSVFPEGRYFSRTLEETGPLGQLTGTSGWREFTLPFDRTGTGNAPNRIEVNLHLPGRGVVFVGPLRLVEFGPDKAAEDMLSAEERNQDARPQAGKVVEMAEAWLSGIDAGGYETSWNDAAEFFRKSITAEAWSDAMTKARKPLGAVKSRKLVKAEKADTLPGAPDGEYIVMRFETSFEAKEKAAEIVTFMKQADGTWKAAGYFII